MTWEWTGGQYEARVGNVLAEVWYGDATLCWWWRVSVDDGSGVGADGRCVSEFEGRREAEAAMREWWS